MSKFAHIEHAVQVFNEDFRDRYWMEEEQQWRWSYYNVNIRVVCAANRYGDYIVIGARHYCLLMNMQIDSVGGIELLREYAKHVGGKYEQGFVDQYCNFLTRKEAFDIAHHNGQILDYLDGQKILFSEMLY